MHVGIEELTQKWTDGEIERDDLVTLLADFKEEAIKASDFAEDIKDDVYVLKKELNDGNAMKML